MPQKSADPKSPAPPAKAAFARRLLLAAVMIGVAVGGLALLDRSRGRSGGIAPPHEPSQALITTPSEQSEAPQPTSEPAMPPPEPPKVVNDETLAPPRRTAAGPIPVPDKKTAAQADAIAGGKSYLVQVGVFASPANAQALQKQLQRAGIDATLETRVQLGPFNDRRAAAKAMAQARKLGINAVLVGAR